MATYTSITTSNNAKITSEEAVKEILEEWDFIPSHGEITASIDNNTIAFHGSCDFEPYRVEDVDDPDDQYDNIDQEGFLEALLPHLEERLTIQTVGNEKHRFPLGQRLKIADPDLGQVVTSTSLEWQEFLEQKARTIASRTKDEDTNVEDVETVTVSVTTLEDLAAEGEATLERINDPAFHEGRGGKTVRQALADAGQALNQDQPIEAFEKDADYWQER